MFVILPPSPVGVSIPFGNRSGNSSHCVRCAARGAFSRYGPCAIGSGIASSLPNEVIHMEPLSAAAHTIQFHPQMLIPGHLVLIICVQDHRHLLFICQTIRKLHHLPHESLSLILLPDNQHLGSAGTSALLSACGSQYFRHHRSRR